jgi:hypothetical protein
MLIIKEKLQCISIPDGTLLSGELPPNKHKLVVAWMAIHQEDLLADWNLVVNGKKPFPIRRLDQRCRRWSYWQISYQSVSGI